MPDGYPLTVPAFQSIGRILGYPGGFQTIHYMVEEAFVKAASGRELSDSFLDQTRTYISFITNPLYAIMHEAVYARGAATDWAAARARREFPQFSYESSLANGSPVFFTGEMMYPWMFEQDPALRPLCDAAQILAHYDGWPRLYDPGQLAVNEVPVAASIYLDDMYVDACHSQQTAERIRDAHVWVTDEYDHESVRDTGGQVMKRLRGMLLKTG